MRVPFRAPESERPSDWRLFEARFSALTLELSRKRGPQDRPVTSLDTKSITAPDEDLDVISIPWRKHPDRLAWELQVAAENSAHDYARSIVLLERGAVAYQDQVRTLEWRSALGTHGTRPPHGLASADEFGIAVVEEGSRKQVAVSQWHYDRAMARRNRAARLTACGTSDFVVACTCALGHEHHHDMGCGDYRLCISCRRRRVVTYRRDARNYAEELRERASRVMLGTAIQDRLLTLTAPDYGTTEERLAIRTKAWRLFSRRLQRSWKRDAERLAGKMRASVDEVRDSFGFLRVLEVTPGADELGHFHHHVWMHAPWLSQADAHDWWRETVLYVVRRTCSKELLAIYESAKTWQVDVRQADPATFDQELIKYLLKDWSESKDGERMGAVAFGRILRALDGTRMRQGSAGWAAIAEERRELPLCRTCGTSVVVELRRVNRAPREAIEPVAHCDDFERGTAIRPPPETALPHFGEQQHLPGLRAAVLR